MEYFFHVVLFALGVVVWLAAAYFGMKWMWEWRQKFWFPNHGKLQTLFGSDPKAKN